MANFSPSAWLRQHSTPPEVTPDDDLVHIHGSAYDALEALLRRHDISSRDSTEIGNALQAKLAKLRNADVPDQAAIDELQADRSRCRSLLDVVLASAELAPSKGFAPEAVSAELSGDGVPRRVVLSFGAARRAEEAPELCVVRVGPPMNSLLEQVRIGQGVIGDARRALGDRSPRIVGLVGNGDGESLRESFSDAWDQTLEVIPNEAVLVVDCPSAAMDRLAAALNDHPGRQPDMVLCRAYDAASARSLTSIPTRNVSPNSLLWNWSQDPVAYGQLAGMATLGRRERRDIEKVRGALRGFAGRLSAPGSRHLYDTSAEFATLVGELAQHGSTSDGLRPLWFADDQLPRHSPSSRQTPCLLGTVGDLAVADRLRLIVANDPDVPTSETVRAELDQRGNAVHAGEEAIAVLLGGRTFQPTVDGAIARIRGYNPRLEITTTMQGELAEPPSRSGARSAVSAVRSSALSRGGSAVVGDIKARLRRRSGGSL